MHMHKFISLCSLLNVIQSLLCGRIRNLILCIIWLVFIFLLHSLPYLFVVHTLMHMCMDLSERRFFLHIDKNKIWHVDNKKEIYWLFIVWYRIFLTWIGNWTLFCYNWMNVLFIAAKVSVWQVVIIHLSMYNWTQKHDILLYLSKKEKNCLCITV